MVIKKGQVVSKIPEKIMRRIYRKPILEKLKFKKGEYKKGRWFYLEEVGFPVALSQKSVVYTLFILL